MKNIWNKFTAWLSGWPEGTKENKKIKADEEHFKREEIIKEQVKESKARKVKKPKGLNPKKKKKARKQRNLG
tara:strand:- start:266 stop:481 length:216 start_codon:yes stop_codon:yes gene_type:complete